MDMAFFDKTGTLTKQGLEFISAQGCEEAALLPLAEGAVPPDSLLGTGMAVCHTLNVSKERGVIIGNAVDTMMFETTHAKIERFQVPRPVPFPVPEKNALKGVSKGVRVLGC